MKLLRPTFIAVLVACASLLAASAALSAVSGRASAASQPPDTTGLLTPWRIEPAHPCERDSVFMVVRGFVATPCDSFLGAEAIGPLHVRIRVQHYTDRVCFAAPFQFFPVPVTLGVFPAGTHTGLVDIEDTYTPGDTGATVTTQQFRFEFSVAPECGPAPVPVEPLPFVRSISTDPERPCAGRPTSLVLSGAFPNSCGQVIDSYVGDPSHVGLTLKVGVLPDSGCAQLVVPWKVTFDLGVLPAGSHRTDITLVVLAPDSSNTGYERRVYDGGFQFWVYGSCDSAPSPGPLPYVNWIAVGPAAPCGPAPICPGDSILVRVGGVFPHECFSFRGIALVPSPITVVPPPPPTVRIIVDDGGCYEQICSPGEFPWQAAVILPAMAPGVYQLPVELAQVTCSDTYPPGQLHHTDVGFTVEQSCPAAPPCLHAAFAQGPSECNATVSPTHAAEVTFEVGPSVALAGLQGAFALSSTALKVTGVEPVGVASGMLLSWNQTQDGARFVLLAASGAPIPPVGKSPDAWPVLRITVAAAGPGTIPDRTALVNESLLGSDIGGQGVPFCPPPPCVSADLRLAAPTAFICAEHACDFNADGVEDIRDLVLMVHCVSGEGPCPPDATTHFDCDGDSTLAIADILCCAREILLRPYCPNCAPDSGTVRPEPRVSVSFGTPVESGDGIALPVMIEGSDRLGAAMLTLDLPLDRYEATGLDAGGNWLALHDEQGGHLVLGMIGLGSGHPRAPGPATFMLRLKPRPGATTGGIVTATAGEFSGPDGVRLGVTLGHPSQALPGNAGVALGVNQPNPFSRETAFTLDLVENADVTVTIFDLRGRRVTVLHRSALEAGAHVFHWDGHRSDGSEAPNGVYFYQATVAGRSLSRKLILMRGN